MVDTCWKCRRTGAEIESEIGFIVVAMQEIKVTPTIKVKVCPPCIRIMNVLAKRRAERVIKDTVLDADGED